MNRAAIAVALLATVPLAALSSPEPSAARAAQERASEWQIGPILRGRSYSPGMPRYATDAVGETFFDIPWPTPREGHVHYVTVPTGSLTGARRIVLRYRIEGERGVRILPEENPRQKATLSLYFQRGGDNWTAKGRYATYRWYAPAAMMGPLTPGTHEVSVPLDANWTAVQGANRNSAPEAFARALEDASRVGFVLGSNGGRGHGVFATAPARFTILDFWIE